MDIIKKILYLCIILVFVTMITLCLSGCNNKKETSIKDKISIETRYLDNRIFEIIDIILSKDNTNYEVSTEKKSIKSKETEDGKDSKEEGNKKDQSSQGDDKESESGKKNESSGESEGTSKDNKEITVLSIEDRYDNQLSKQEWKEIEKNIEALYLPWDTMQNDLMSIDNINKDDIQKINYNLDNLLNFAVKNDQNNFIKEVSDIYMNITNIAEKLEYDKKYIVMLKVKQNMIEIYYNIKNDNWDLAKNNLNMAIDYLKNIEEKDSRLNVTINSLLYTIDSKQDKIFMSKYINVIDEIKNSEM